MSHNGSSETSSFVDENWTSWFCGLSGNQFFCEVEKSYIEDSFNLFGLKQYLSKDYTKALDTILDRLTPMEPESEELSRSAALLYGLIHARYIITSHGLEAMHRKFQNREFGDCPRAFCRGQPVVPVRTAGSAITTFSPRSFSHYC
jgi:casein kinase II subunit beta